jgi:hypothetical protein
MGHGHKYKTNTVSRSGFPVGHDNSGRRRARTETPAAIWSRYGWCPRARRAARRRAPRGPTCAALRSGSRPTAAAHGWRAQNPYGRARRRGPCRTARTYECTEVEKAAWQALVRLYGCLSLAQLPWVWSAEWHGGLTASRRSRARAPRRAETRSAATPDCRGTRGRPCPPPRSRHRRRRPGSAQPPPHAGG